MQPRVQFISYDNLDKTIIVAVNVRRLEFFIKPDRFPRALYSLKYNLENEWFNKALTELLVSSQAVEIDGYRVNSAELSIRTLKEDTIPMAESSRTPTNEFPFTVIAPTAHSLTYYKQRQWFRTAEDARDMATGVYEGEPKKNFQLAIVKWVELVEPKPTVELKSTKFEELDRGHAQPE